MSSKFIKGTVIMTVATFLSKFLGMIYIIPFNYLVGARGAALYSYAYIPYMILISLSTIGIPLGVSKFVAKYNELGDFKTSQKLFRSGLVVMTMTGFIACLSLLFGAKYIAPYVIGSGDKTGSSIDDVVFVMQMVSVALIIIPPMSLIRGYFQGFQTMKPTAISTVVEQIVRIVAILLGSYLIIYVWHGTIESAVGFATFAAFLGAIASMLILIGYYISHRPMVQQQIKEQTVSSDISLKAMYKELITYAIPFVFVGISMPLYQLIDQFTFNRTLMSVGYSLQDAEVAFGALNTYSQKIVMIPVSFATALSLSLIPVITEAFVGKKQMELQKLISQSLQITIFLTVPMAFGIFSLSTEIYGLLFGKADVMIGGEMLKYYAPVAILLALYSVSTALLQGINKQKYVMASLSGGLLFKLILNVPFLKLFGATGSIFATALGYSFAIGLNLFILQRFAYFPKRLVVKRSFLVLLFTAIMVVVVVGITSMFNRTFSSTYDHLTFKALFGAAVGMMVYVYLAYRSHLAEKILGEKIAIFARITNLFKRFSKRHSS